MAAGTLENGRIWYDMQVGIEPGTHLGANGTSPLLFDDLNSLVTHARLRDLPNKQVMGRSGKVLLAGVAAALLLLLAWAHKNGVLKPGGRELKLRMQRGWHGFRGMDVSEPLETPFLDRLRELYGKQDQSDTPGESELEVGDELDEELLSLADKIADVNARVRAALSKAPGVVSPFDPDDDFEAESNPIAHWRNLYGR